MKLVSTIPNKVVLCAVICAALLSVGAPIFMTRRPYRSNASTADCMPAATPIPPGQQQKQQQHKYPTPHAPALRFAVINQEPSHLEVVVGVMHVLRGLTSLDVHVYLHAKVLARNMHGFASWMRGIPGVAWRQLTEYDGREQYDLAWFLSPEYNIPYVELVIASMQPKVTLLYVHNAHMPEPVFARLRKLQAAAGVPFVTLAPHVARYIQNRTAGTDDAVDPVWILPVYPYAATRECGMLDNVGADKVGGGAPCLHGFSVQGRIESSRRNYSDVWRQIADFRRQHGNQSLSSFRLNILGQAVGNFIVPREFVSSQEGKGFRFSHDLSLSLIILTLETCYTRRNTQTSHTKSTIQKPMSATSLMSTKTPLTTCSTSWYPTRSRCCQCSPPRCITSPNFRPRSTRA